MLKYIVTALAVGVIAGYLNYVYGDPFVNGVISDYLFNGLLVALLFVMGLSFGSDKKSVDKLKKAGFKVLIIPFAVALGSILSGFFGGLILEIEVISSMAICAGYGWYSLTGPLIGQIFGLELGALGFTVNFLRELLTITTISLAVKVDKYAPIASGGATTMDTTLPIIVRYCGSDVLITAFSSGFILTLTAPFTILAIASLR
jgi:uncharacterized membrane protein YbjE (DUF340 family)